MTMGQHSKGNVAITRSLFLEFFSLSLKKEPLLSQSTYARSLIQWPNVLCM